VRKSPVQFFQREASLYANDRSTSATRSDGCDGFSDVPTANRTVGILGQDVSSQHIHPT
jgi:hypothetical protein